MTLRRCLLAACFLSVLATSSNVDGRQYPATQYQGFSSNNWSTDSPVVPDLGPHVRSEVSMSPDSWGAPSTADGLTEFQRRPAESTIRLTPVVPDLSELRSFQSASVYGSQPVPAPNSMRYPLTNDQQNLVTQDAARSDEGQSIFSNSNPFDSSRPTDNFVPGDSVPEQTHPASRPVSVPDFSSPDGWYELDSDFQSSNSAPGPVHSGNQSQTNGYGYGIPNYRPDLGHRSNLPTYRHAGPTDHGERFGFEDKKNEYPPMSEILATGRFFGSGSVLYLKGAFQGNTAISTSGPGFGESVPFDFDYEAAPQFRLGFESSFGPGVELDYWQYDESSNVASFTSDGTVVGTTSTWMLGANQWSNLQATGAGERIDVTHSIDVEGVGASFFKEVQFKISRISGTVGFQYLNISQTLDATLSSGGTELGRLNSRTDIEAIGPKFGLEYYRPLGHTKFEFITALGGSVLFGQRDQTVQNTASNDLSRIGADEFITTVDFLSGVQYKKMTAEKRAYYARLGYSYQTWIGGGTAVDAQGDFGLRGFSFTVGYNR